MNNYIKKVERDNIVFIDKQNNTKLVVAHSDDKNIFDTIFIDEKFDINFIDFAVNELKKSNDLGAIYSLYDSLDLENLLYKYNLKIVNYQYNIKYKKHSNVSDYNISINLDDETKEYYIRSINELGLNNHKYLKSNKEFIKFDYRWFNSEEYIYRTYRREGKIVGVVEYKIVENKYSNETSDIFNYNNKLCIRCIFGENIEVLESILKDISSLYKKDIIINVTYSEKDLLKAIKLLNGKFNYCLYTLINI